MTGVKSRRSQGEYLDSVLYPTVTLIESCCDSDTEADFEESLLGFSKHSDLGNTLVQTLEHTILLQ